MSASVPTTARSSGVVARETTAAGVDGARPLATSVDDLALVLSLIAGADGVDAGVVPVPLGEPDALQRFLRKSNPFDAVDTLESERHGDVFQGRQAGDEIIRLEDKSDVGTAIKRPLGAVQGG